MLMIITLIFCTHDIFFSVVYFVVNIVYFVVNIVYFVVHIVCEVDVIANSLVLYLQFCSTLNKMFFLFFFSSHSPPILAVIVLVFCNLIASLSRIFSVMYHLSF